MSILRLNSEKEKEIQIISRYNTMNSQTLLNIKLHDIIYFIEQTSLNCFMMNSIIIITY